MKSGPTKDLGYLQSCPSISPSHITNPSLFHTKLATALREDKEKERRGEGRRGGRREEEERDKKGEEEDGERLFKYSSPNFLPPGERRHVI